MQNIYVVTHAQSQHHIDGKVGGWFDTALTELGRAQAGAAALRLQTLMADKKPYLVSSDLKRAAQTADLIGRAVGTAAVLDKGFRELSYGEAEGKPQSWLGSRMSAAPDDNRLDYAPVKGAETKREFVSRIYTSLSNLPSCTDIIIVTHGYALTFVIAHWIGLPITATGYVNFPAKPGGITHLHEDDFFRNKAVKYISDISHLSGLARSVLDGK